MTPRIELMSVPLPPYRERKPRAVFAAAPNPDEVPAAPTSPDLVPQPIEKSPQQLLEEAQDYPSVADALEQGTNNAKGQVGGIGGTDGIRKAAEAAIDDAHRRAIARFPSEVGENQFIDIESSEPLATPPKPPEPVEPAPILKVPPAPPPAPVMKPNPAWGEVIGPRRPVPTPATPFGMPSQPTTPPAVPNVPAAPPRPPPPPPPPAAPIIPQPPAPPAASPPPPPQPPAPPSAPPVTPRPPRKTPIPSMGMFESWWKRFDLPSRPQNVYDTLVMSFHKKFAQRQRGKMERAAEELSLMRGIIRDNEKRVAKREEDIASGTWKRKAGEITRDQLQDAKQRLLKMERKQNKREQTEKKWINKRDQVITRYVDRLEAKTDPILGEMDRLDAEGKEVAKELLGHEQTIQRLRSAHRDITAQGGSPAILMRINAQINREFAAKQEAQHRIADFGKQKRRMNRATSVWSDRQNTLRDLRDRRSRMPAQPPQEVTPSYRVTEPSAPASMRSPEPMRAEGEAPEPSMDIGVLFSEWGQLHTDPAYALSTSLQTRIRAFLKKRQGPEGQATRNEFADILGLVKPRWKKQIQEYRNTFK